MQCMCVSHEGGHVALRVFALCDVVQSLACVNNNPTFSPRNNSETLTR